MVTWPEGRSFGATISFDFDAEEVWIGEDPENEHRPGVLSQGAYGPKVAIPLLLALLERHQITATFYVPGKDAERHPDSVRAIIAAGHEIGHHGYTHRSPSALTPAEEEAELVRGLSVLRALGADVVGYRSPSWDFSRTTLDLLIKYGFEYSSNLMDDLKPYRHQNHDLVEVPVSWLLDDAPHFWFAGDTWTKTIRSPEEVYQIWLAELEGIALLGGHFMLTMHPQIIGRPSRLAMLDRLLGDIEARGAWIAPARQIASLV
ncbi:polysaccharide deacetylase family protein [Glaciibacter psychrotolerans]|uniref:Peptidoglycan/xylan/chitin deacetylase (PgdA/CDA1 family) n=1 Tax=Glaciibacter psychrotolerans TaxID=670054 RepID=A0A7Z0J6H7_9MICO|nr:polysaccharide deacetylase [Leifsonia psychrotolerans]NYJ20527.1 peptidoglycan/xylan/chitin deacetylase (PgdA/CDA1 family) [Leifsonia psychrotolerans]